MISSSVVLIQRFNGFAFALLFSVSLTIIGRVNGVCQFGALDGDMLAWRNSTIENMFNATYLNITLAANRTLGSLTSDNYSLIRTLENKFFVPYSLALVNIKDQDFNTIDWKLETYGITVNQGNVSVDLVQYIASIYTYPLCKAFKEITQNFSYSFGLFRTMNLLYRFKGVESKATSRNLAYIPSGYCYSTIRYLVNVTTSYVTSASSVYGTISPILALGDFFDIIDRRFDGYFRANGSQFQGRFCRASVFNYTLTTRDKNGSVVMELYFVNATDPIEMAEFLFTQSNYAGRYFLGTNYTYAKSLTTYKGEIRMYNPYILSVQGLEIPATSTTVLPNTIISALNVSSGWNTSSLTNNTANLNATSISNQNVTTSLPKANTTLTIAPVLYANATTTRLPIATTLNGTSGWNTTSLTNNTANLNATSISNQNVTTSLPKVNTTLTIAPVSDANATTTRLPIATALNGTSGWNTSSLTNNTANLNATSISNQNVTTSLPKVNMTLTIAPVLDSNATTTRLPIVTTLKGTSGWNTSSLTNNTANLNATSISNQNVTTSLPKVNTTLTLALVVEVNKTTIRIPSVTTLSSTSGWNTTILTNSTANINATTILKESIFGSLSNLTMTTNATFIFTTNTSTTYLSNITMTSNITFNQKSIVMTTIPTNISTTLNFTSVFKENKASSLPNNTITLNLTSIPTVLYTITTQLPNITTTLNVPFVPKTNTTSTKLSNFTTPSSLTLAPQASANSASLPANIYDNYADYYDTNSSSENSSYLNDKNSTGYNQNSSFVWPKGTNSLYANLTSSPKIPTNLTTLSPSSFYNAGFNVTSSSTLRSIVANATTSSASNFTTFTRLINSTSTKATSTSTILHNTTTPIKNTPIWTTLRVMTTALKNTSMASSTLKTTTTPYSQNSSGTSTSTKKATTIPAIDQTTFDSDPFFRAVVPEIRKVYNDKVLMKQFVTMPPVTANKFFYTIAIPTGICMVLFSVCCLVCLNIDCAAAIAKKKELFQ